MQVVDVDRLPVGRVDDLEIVSEEGAPRVTALLIGQRHLGPRLGGITGGVMARSAQRLAADPAAARVDVTEVASWSDLVALRRRLVDLPIAGLEKWLAGRVVTHLPGADDAGI
jgi:hypothetical protein